MDLLPGYGTHKQCTIKKKKKKSWNNARLKLPCKFGESKCNPYYRTPQGTIYVINERLDFSHYDSYAIPSEIIPWYNHHLWITKNAFMVCFFASQSLKACFQYTIPPPAAMLGLLSLAGYSYQAIQTATQSQPGGCRTISVRKYLLTRAPRDTE